MRNFILFLQLVTATTYAQAAAGADLERFQQAEELLVAHLDPQTDKDMLELMRQLSTGSPPLQSRYRQALHSLGRHTQTATQRLWPRD